MDLQSHIAAVPDFPKPGILFRDITPLVAHPPALQAAVDQLAEQLAGVEFDRIAAIESRGFVFGAPLSLALGKGLILVRKAGKLPRQTVAETYDLEYGTATIEVHGDAIATGEKVVILDDLIATGGTAAAAGNLVRRCGAKVAAYLFVIELEGLAGRKLLSDAPVFSLVRYP